MCVHFWSYDCLDWCLFFQNPDAATRDIFLSLWYCSLLRLMVELEACGFWHGGCGWGGGFRDSYDIDTRLVVLEILFIL